MQMLWLVLLFTFVAEVESSPGSYYTYDDSRDDQLCSPLVKWAVSDVRKDVSCMSRCTGSPECYGVFYNSISGSCVGLGSLPDNTPCPTDIGYRFFRKDYDDGGWVTEVLGFSSEYGYDDWSAGQLIGQANVYPIYDDDSWAWAPDVIDNNQWLEVGFARLIYLRRIEIYETYHAGAVTEVSAWNGEMYSTIWNATGPAQDLLYSRVFSPEFEETSFATKRLRLEIDCTVSDDWVEIDAVRILGIYA